MPLPSLIVVAGPPGAGKTTLAHALAQAVRCPVVSRDEIKEGLVNAAGGEGGASEDLTARAYEAFFATLSLLLDHGVTVVAEAAFQHSRWVPGLEPLAEIARLRLIVCTVAPEVARSRRIARAHDDPDRAAFHPDPGVGPSPKLPGPVLPFDPPRLDVPTLTVSTLEGYEPDFETLVAFARG